MTGDHQKETQEADSNTSSDDDSKSAVETLEVTREMGRAVIDHQIESLSGLNDKAAYTIRLNILILGVLLTVYSLLANTGVNGQSPSSHVINGGVGTGVLLSSMSILAAIWTYTSTRKEVGPTGDSILKAINGKTGYSKRGWLKGTIRAQANWIDTNDRVNRRDSFMLFISHLYLFVSIGFYAFGVTWGLKFWQEPTIYYWVSVYFLAFLLPSIVLAPKYAPKERIPNRIIQSISNAINGLMDDK